MPTDEEIETAMAHPILKELSRQLPESTFTYQYIQEPRDIEDIAAQAKKEYFCLGNMEGVTEDGQPAKSVLEQSGYQAWLEECEEDERLRVLGALKLIVELAEELAED